MRKPLPRWRQFIKTVEIGELCSISKFSPELLTKYDADLLKSEIEQWQKEKSLGVATDILGTALLTQHNTGLDEIAEFIVKNKFAPKTSLELSNQILNNNFQLPNLQDFKYSVPNHFDIVRSLKKRIVSEPRNAIVYVDLALQYTILGQNKKAQKSIEVALKLAPENRFILRAAARFFIHIDAKDQAHKILRRSNLGKYDTWVAASEIAVANFANNPSRFAKSGLMELTDKNHDPKNVSELASALATLEMTNGKHKNSNKLFKVSLIAPNDNSVAQAEWASRHGQADFLLDEQMLNQIPCAFEAKTWEYLETSRWKDSFEQAKLWYWDQPFSTLPASTCAFIESIIFGNYENGNKYLLQALKLKPHNLIVINDLAFGYASLNKITEAEDLLQRVDFNSLSGIDEVALTATTGLIHFRKGEIKVGQEKYMEAIKLSKKLHKNIQFTANMYFTREALLANIPEAPEMLKIIQAQLEQIESSEVRAIFDSQIGHLILNKALK